MNTIDRSGCTGTRHGTNSAYKNYRCRCPDARELNRLYHKRRVERRLLPAHVPAIGTLRRLQALAALGHPHAVVVAAAGLPASQVKNLRCSSAYRIRPMVHRNTAAAVGKAYDVLSMRVGPCERTRREAARLKYAPPLAWNDESIDDPAARPVTALPRKRDGLLAEALWLVSWGVSREEAARRVGVKVESVRREHERRLQKQRAS